MSTTSAERGSGSEDRRGRVFPFPIKLYLYGELLFELYCGSRSPRRSKPAYEKAQTGVYRSGNLVFEIHDGGQSWGELSISWERVGFPANALPVQQPTLQPGQSATSQEDPGSLRQQGEQLPLWSLDKQMSSRPQT